MRLVNRDATSRRHFATPPISERHSDHLAARARNTGEQTASLQLAAHNAYFNMFKNICPAKLTQLSIYRSYSAHCIGVLRTGHSFHGHSMFTSSYRINTYIYIYMLTTSALCTSICVNLPLAINVLVDVAELTLCVHTWPPRAEIHCSHCACSMRQLNLIHGVD